jgi:prepilin-type N-terminal cleavage/methylation domain-containing protein
MLKIIKQSGFTLIELMLVVAILAAITVIGVSAYKQQAANFMADKTALQMQQLMEAAIAFKVDCGMWPGNNSGDVDLANPMLQLEGVDRSGNPVATCNKRSGAQPGVAYIQRSSAGTSPLDKDPWGGAYVLISPEGTTHEKYFTVTTATDIPSQGLAARIAGRLPNSTYSTTPQPPYSVTANVDVPGGPGGSSGNIMFKVVSSNTQLTNPCPSGQAAHLYLGMNSFDTRPGPSGIGFYPTNITVSDAGTLLPRITTANDAYNTTQGNMLAIICCGDGCDIPPPSSLKQAIPFKNNSNSGFTF